MQYVFNLALGLRTVDPPLGPPSTPVEIFLRTYMSGGGGQHNLEKFLINFLPPPTSVTAHASCSDQLYFFCRMKSFQSLSVLNVFQWLR